MFSFIKNKLQKIFSTVTSKLGSFFSKNTIDDAALKELEILLISSDVGVGTTKSIIAELKKQIDSVQTEELEQLRQTVFTNQNVAMAIIGPIEESQANKLDERLKFGAKAKRPILAR